MGEMNIGIVVDDPVVRDLAISLRAANHHRLSEVASLEELERMVPLPDALIMRIQNVADLHDSSPIQFMRISRTSRIIAILRSEDILESADALAYADGWVFQDVNEHHIDEVITLSHNGYCLVPMEFLSSAGGDRIRLKLLNELAEEEYRTLTFLAQGMSNRELAAQLGCSEQRVRSLTQRVLSTLHFRNRTEAAVFAVRHRLDTRSADMALQA